MSEKNGMEREETITQWIAGLKDSDQDAARELWDRYFEKLVALARRRMSDGDRRVADEEDVAISVFRCLCRGAERQQFSRLSDRDDLWSLLVKMTKRKVIDQHRRQSSQKRGSGGVRGESIFAAGRSGDEPRGQFDQVVGDEPTPEFLAQIAEEHCQMLARLPDDTFRQVAILKMEGMTNEEIAEKLQLSCRSIERKLGKIRESWSRESGDASDRPV